MSQSLAPECTPLKHAYDDCFNSWFAGYLQPTNSKDGEEGSQAFIDARVKEYHEKCGKLWEEYRECLTKAVEEKGLDEVLDKAREEAPLRDIKSVDDDS